MISLPEVSPPHEPQGTPPPSRRIVEELLWPYLRSVHPSKNVALPLPLPLSAHPVFPESSPRHRIYYPCSGLKLSLDPSSRRLAIATTIFSTALLWIVENTSYGRGAPRYAFAQIRIPEILVRGKYIASVSSKSSTTQANWSR